MNLIKEIHSYLSDDIKSMNTLIVDNLAVDEELITLVSNHLANSGGKRMRPVLTILSAKMFGYEGGDAIRLASAVEFIHMATLLHDDVVDGSKMRRFLPSANVLWGNKASILVGDFLFSQSFKMIVSTQLMPALVVLSNASAVIAEGEVSQLAQLEQKKLLSEKEYLDIINAKTAELFGSACEVGAIVAGREDCAKDLKEFGLRLGNIFQIADDALDYFGDSDKVGKNVGDDFYEGKITLPLILLAKKMSGVDGRKLQKLFAGKERSVDDFTWVKNLMQQYNLQDDIILYLQDIKQNAYDALERIDTQNKCKEYLKSLVEFAISRTH
ncbi:MAG: polyprenyl synthetase family protein [Rickettsiaceae bacterium]|nr:polyprenyl synthetase family protein [Rickettsiaceae bacterium]MDP5020664.1 polyprenyl synthetase family protein [Rickettsiaceae bacterium]MDP5083638.1 polyprenyl synthetase family protein [Rickettsiaceae bacterium]